MKFAPIIKIDVNIYAIPLRWCVLIESNYINQLSYHT